MLILSDTILFPTVKLDFPIKLLLTVKVLFKFKSQSQNNCYVEDANSVTNLISYLVISCLTLFNSSVQTTAPDLVH